MKRLSSGITQRIALIFFSQLVILTSYAQKAKWLEGTFYTEANYGYTFYGENRNIYDFPHVVLDLTVHMGRGWHFTTEQEIEYLSENGDHPKKFSDMYSCNWAYFQKDFSPKAKLLVGILNVPVGLTSSFYGTGLTIYDPSSEARVLPMKWHETGVALTGSLGRWEYWIGYLAHVDVKLKRSGNMGVAARVIYSPIDALKVSVNGFVGEGAELSKLTRDGFADDGQSCQYLGVDYKYDDGHFVSSGEFDYLSTTKDRAAGAEVGYHVTPKVIPFVRYDWGGVNRYPDYSQVTAGINVEVLKNVIIKAQVEQSGSKTRMDTSVDYTLDF